MRELDEATRDAFLQRKIANDARHKMRFACSDRAVEQKTLLAGAEFLCPAVQTHAHLREVSNRLARLIHDLKLLQRRLRLVVARRDADRKSTRLNSSHVRISYAV